MTNIPTLNYQNIYFFLMSLFGVIFVLSLMDMIRVKHPMAIMIVSFVNIFLGIFAWIGDTKFEYDLKNAHTGMGHKKADIESYRNNKFWNFVGVTASTFLSTAIGLGVQLI